MKFFPLVWAQLWRKKTRTVLTLLSLVTAFMLLGLLQVANSLFNSGGAVNSAGILITQARVSFTTPLPLRLQQQLQGVPGVVAVTHSQFFGGIYQDPTQRFAQFATDPALWLKVFPECVLSPEQTAAWEQIRTGAVIGRRLADRFGWKVGDRIPLISQIWPLKDGSRNWSFDIVGIYDERTEDSCGRMGGMYFRYDYFDEARQFGQGTAGIYALRLANPDDAQAIAAKVDAMFENSPDETKTQTERDFQLSFAKQVGNLSLIMNLILVSVFFSILMLTGNTMTQAIRERIPELAVLKTLGFTDTSVLWLVLSEALMMCMLGALGGMVMASLAMVVLPKLVSLPPMVAEPRIWLFALAAAALLSLIIGAVPALRAKRLSIVDALAGR